MMIAERRHVAAPKLVHQDRTFSHPENRQSEQEQNDEDDHEDVEQHAGDIGGCGRNAGESQNASYDGHDEKQQRPFE
jgi:hypothetical protein